jgi:hypothetical protein
MSYLKVGDVGWSIKDTGFGNRIQFWEIAYELNKFNSFKFTILVEANKWRETKFLNFPYTESSNIRFNNLKDLPEIDARYPWLNKLDINASWDIMGEWPPYQVGDEFYGKWLHLITLKDKVFEKKIKKVVKDRIGIHIRHWPVIDTDPRSNPVERFNYVEKMKLVRETMDKYPNSKFYISTDVTYDKPAIGPPLPDFRKESHWISEIYRDYDVIDYRDIISVDNVISKTVRDYKNKMWSNILDDEGEISKVLIYNKEHLIDGDENIDDVKIKRDVIDLFSLIYSKGFIPSDLTGPNSSWSDFVEIYRKNI